MATAMPPPIIPGFSLRVQLYSPNAYSSTDKPIRCFRVVTRPDITIREFCQEASRIHEINYGQSLAIKKCQDDQEFDVTQSEITGNLFASAATIRVIQASAHPSVRDSVPPTSALRFDPASVIGQKRDRETSPSTNGASPSSPYKPNKRQRISDLDPDLPIPSLESQDGAERMNGRTPDSIPNSQENVILGNGNGPFSTSRHVRHDLPQIPETPSVSPPPSVLRSQYEINADQDRQKHADNRTNLLPEIRKPSAAKDSPGRVQLHTSTQQRAKSASYHIHRPTDRGTSVSTAATSPLSADQQYLTSNGITSASRKPSYPISSSRKSSGSKDRSENEDSLYENIVSDDEGSAILKARKAALRARNSPNPGLQGSNNKFNTPPSGRRRSNENTNTPGELPLTPNSKELERMQKQKQEADDARKARLAAAEAAEQRKREADEARQDEKAHRAGEERSEREEQENIEVEEFKRNEAERAARLKREREEKDRPEAGEKRIAQVKKETESLPRDKAHAEESKGRLEARQRLVGQLRADRLEGKATKEAESSARITSSPPRDLRHAKSSSPVLPRASLFVRAQSTTGFYPAGRKSALKSSAAARTSSPPASKASPSNNVGIDAQMPLPRSASRRVSFEGVPEEIPITLSSRVSPAKPPTPQSATPKAIVTPSAASTSTPKPVSTTPIPPPQPAYRRIVPPSAIKRTGSERSITPQVHKNAAPVQTPKNPSPKVANNMSPPAPFSARRSHTPVIPLVLKEKYKSVSAEPPAKKLENVELSSEESGSEYSEEEGEESEEEASNKSRPKKAALSTQSYSVAKKVNKESDEDEESGDDSEEEIPSRVSPAKLAPHSQSRSPVKPVEESENEADVETASHLTSSRDSRSPVVYSLHERTPESNNAQRSPSPESDHTSDKDEADDDSTSENGTAKGKKYETNFEIEDESSESEDDDDDTTIQVPKSSPVLPKSKPASKQILQSTLSKSNPNQNTSKAQSPLGSDPSTQEELDQQLTSSMIEARTTVPTTSSPAPSSSMAPHVPRYGASLMNMNQKKQTLSSPAPNSGNGKGKQQLKLQEDEDDDSEEESEEDNDDDESDDIPASISKSTLHKPSESTSDSDSDSDDSDTSSSEGDEDATVKIRNELAATIQNIHSQSQGVVITSPKAFRSTREGAKEKKEKEG